MAAGGIGCVFLTPAAAFMHMQHVQGAPHLMWAAAAASCSQLADTCKRTGWRCVGVVMAANT
jgi:hypothetical protein